jgi:hypothetical protein
MKQIYSLELNKEEIKLLKSNCEMAYQVYRENWSFKMMRKNKGIEKRLNDLENKIKEEH